MDTDFNFLCSQEGWLLSAWELMRNDTNEMTNLLINFIKFSLIS